jgi:hypothetical protein
MLKSLPPVAQQDRQTNEKGYQDQNQPFSLDALRWLDRRIGRTHGWLVEPKALVEETLLPFLPYRSLIRGQRLLQFRLAPGIGALFLLLPPLRRGSYDCVTLGGSFSNQFFQRRQIGDSIGIPLLDPGIRSQVALSGGLVRE